MEPLIVPIQNRPSHPASRIGLAHFAIDQIRDCHQEPIPQGFHFGKARDGLPGVPKAVYGAMDVLVTGEGTEPGIKVTPPWIQFGGCRLRFVQIVV